ncbi:hypothetical protein Pmani_026590 [Petrolisthes manimaculis]|uniref:G-protein coupled receptors family 2 profile 1 domain-containing protein n=1 Tax=Petrolisthes manimaculis TaxID=1843537 RepID=A0AAE1P5Q9_9EUCA|nr:hypothetical protein Pmani_026590 [Petrolisthes manimaculis]
MFSTAVIILLTLLVSVKSEGVDTDRWRATSLASYTDYNNNNNSNKPSSNSPSSSSSSYSSSNSPSPSPYYSPSNSASSSSSTPLLPSTCRLGYSVKQYYPTEKNIYQQLTCYACYTFIPTHRRNHTLHIEDRYVKLSDGAQYQVKMFKIEDKMYPFDPDEAEAWQHVRASMSNSVEADKLEDCCWEAVQCCRQKLNDESTDNNNNNNDDDGDNNYNNNNDNNNNDDNSNHNNNDEDGDNINNNNTTSSSSSWCPRTWDGWSCIPATPPHTTLTITCPHHAYTGYPECTLTGQASCTEEGKWEQNEHSHEHTDYSTCSHESYHLVNYHWEAVTHLVSILALVPALIIIVTYRQLRVQRFWLHLSLLLALTGEAVFTILDIWIIRASEYRNQVDGTSHLDENSVWCRMLVTCRKVLVDI